jgi:early secretory antigenic target protein ESAT-6
MTSYQVDSEAVAAATTSARASVGRIQAEVSALHSQLTALQGSWTGQAATAFQGVVSEWRGVQERVEQSLTSIGQALGYAAQQYAEIEASNARLFLR